MILQKLKFEAFGPFKDETEIAFDKLNKAGIFLLTGPTGVGKTTIFDAIIFALYGEISNSSGLVEKVRSDFAKPETLTYVELVFSVNNKEYLIHREPSQIKYGRNDKETQHAHQAYLKGKDTTIDGVREVGQKIEEIIGLNANQFRQIVMIPQGEFIRLLTAKSEEKGEILGRLFKTSDIVAFQDKLSEKVKSIKGEIDEVKTILNTKLQMIDIQDEEYLKIIEEEYVNYNDAIKYVSKYINKLFDDKAEAEADYLEQERLFKKKANELNKAKDNNEKLAKLKEMKDAFIELKKSSEEITKLKRSISLSHHANYGRKIEQELDKYKINEDELVNKNKTNELEEERLKESIENVTKEEEEIPDLNIEKDGLKKQIYKLEEDLKKQEEMKDLIDDAKTFPEKIKQLNDLLDDLSDEYQDNLGSISALDVKIDSISGSNINPLIETKNKIEQELEEADKYRDLLKKVNIKKADMAIIVDECKTISEKYTTQKMRFDEIKRLHESELSYQLAEQLNDGLPCPVCGSTYHPNKATKTGDNDEEGTIPLMEERLHNLSMALAEKNGIIGFAKKEILEIEEFINKHPLKSNDNIEEYYKKISDELVVIQKEIESFNKSGEMREDLLNSRKDLIDSNQKNIEKTEKCRLSKQELLIEQAKKKGVMEGVVTNYTKEELERLIDNNKETIIEIDGQIDSINQRKKSFNNLFIELQADIRNNAERILELKSIIKERINSFEEVMSNFNSKDEYNEALFDDDEVVRFNIKVSEYEKEYTLLSSSIGEYEYMLMGINEEDVSVLEEDVSKLEEKQNEIFIKKAEINIKHETNEKIYIDVRNTFSKQEKRIDAYEKVAKISKVASGNNNLKMTFEKYILAVYFEDILIAANKLLAKMTNNRYSLLRNDVLAKGNAKQGLDILVYDYNTGKVRDVKTLSGGESFKAALSLALGLSEIIRWRSSGVEMNTMFIDEGFGMLDLDSLDSAMNVLMALKDNRRVIGLISHVSELKERINAQIAFESSTSGSKMKKITT